MKDGGDKAEGYASAVFPAIRRRPAMSMTSSMFSVQPMAVPSASIFYVDYVSAKYCRDEGHSGNGGPITECPHPDCVVRSVIDS